MSKYFIEYTKKKLSSLSFSLKYPKVIVFDTRNCCITVIIASRKYSTLVVVTYSNYYYHLSINNLLAHTYFIVCCVYLPDIIIMLRYLTKASGASYTFFLMLIKQTHTIIMNDCCLPTI